MKRQELNAREVPMAYLEQKGPPVRVTLRLKPPAEGCRPDVRVVRLNFNLEHQRSKGEAMSNDRLVKKLADSAMFREFHRAFTDTTLLPFTIRAVKSWPTAHAESQHVKDSCAFLTPSGQECQACMEMRGRAGEGVNDLPCTMNFSSGLTESSVGVKVGNETVAYLQTGPVFFKQPTVRQSVRALKQIKDGGGNPGAGEVARGHNEMPVVRRREYEGAVRLLGFFATQLGALANQVVLQHQTAEPLQIKRARDFLEKQFREKISLADAARRAGMSRFYFCKMFTKATGVHYTQYLSRIRVEEAKKLLLNLNYRITEVAFEVGFQSLTHFNRVFRGVAGETPTEYRQHLPRA
jgi:AraC-like DNA-binding protein